MVHHPPFRSTALNFRKHSPESSTGGLTCLPPNRHPSAPAFPTREIMQRTCTSRTTHSVAPGPQSRAFSTHSLMPRASIQEGPSNRRLVGRLTSVGPSWHSNALPRRRSALGRSGGWFHRCSGCNPGHESCDSSCVVVDESGCV